LHALISFLVLDSSSRCGQIMSVEGRTSRSVFIAYQLYGIRFYA
jgi:hypothetical protein